jgi:hypothetical protein
VELLLVLLLPESDIEVVTGLFELDVIGPPPTDVIPAPPVTFWFVSDALVVVFVACVAVLCDLPPITVSPA